jgi:hypothetical protein
MRINFENGTIKLKNNALVVAYAQMKSWLNVI